MPGIESRTRGEKAAEKELDRPGAQAGGTRHVAPIAFAVIGLTPPPVHEVQTGFVDNPTTAVGVADRPVTEVMRERGYPVDDFDQRAADISNDHLQIVENYRTAHAVHLSQERGDVDTEQQREAFVHYRALFEKLLETKTDKDTAQEATA